MKNEEADPVNGIGLFGVSDYTSSSIASHSA